MTTVAELYSALKYRVEVDEQGNRRYYNALGQLHCEEGPAVVFSGGSCEWWQNDLRHRTDGPAVEWYGGHKEWWINGVEYTKQEYRTQLKTLGHTV